MIRRDFWVDRIYRAWDSTPVVWLSGVRRIGKTTLAKMIPDAKFVNCDLPSSVRQVADPERFFTAVSQPVVILDEIHRLADPSDVLKIGADEFSHLKILATGSSTLAATAKFRDSLTGRKRMVHLLPVLERELGHFEIKDIKKRLLHGGLPEPLLSKKKDPEFFAEWIDSYYARDIQELFRVGKRQGFLRLIEVILRNSGGLLEQSSLSKHCGLSRPTVVSYMDTLQITHVAFFIRPFHAGGRQELLRQPKVYGFDTGFVSHFRGWTDLREKDCGNLFEHLVLETLLANIDPKSIHYWRDKQKREVDFVIPRARKACEAVECKWNPDGFSVRGLKAFRNEHPKGNNYVVSPQVGEAYRRRIDDLEVTFCNLQQLTALLGA